MIEIFFSVFQIYILFTFPLINNFEISNQKFIIFFAVICQKVLKKRRNPVSYEKKLPNFPFMCELDCHKTASDNSKSENFYTTHL